MVRVMLVRNFPHHLRSHPNKGDPWRGNKSIAGAVSSENAYTTRQAWVESRGESQMLLALEINLALWGIDALRSGASSSAFRGH